MGKKTVHFSSFSESFETLHQATTGGFKNLLIFMLRWSKSIYKLVWPEMLVYIIVFYVLYLSYLFGMDDATKHTWENLVLMISEWGGKLPVEFLLGFYVSNILGRWINTYDSIPRLGSFAITLQRVLYDSKRRNTSIFYRRLICRYVNLAWLLGMRPQSQILQKRLRVPKENLSNDMSQRQYLRMYLESPNEDPVVQRYLREIVTPDEVEVLITGAKEKYEDQVLDKKVEENQLASPDWWIPLQWAGSVVDCASQQGFIANGDSCKALNDAIDGVRAKVGHMIATSQRPLPLVYHQVVIIAIYVYYLSGMIGFQFLDAQRLKDNHTDIGVDSKLYSRYYIQSKYYFPIFSFLKLVFIMGWFKVAFIMLNPYGTDEEDFEFSAVFNNNLRVSALLAESTPNLYPAQLLPALDRPEDFQPSGFVFREVDSTHGYD